MSNVSSPEDDEPKKLIVHVDGREVAVHRGDVIIDTSVRDHKSDVVGYENLEGAHIPVLAIREWTVIKLYEAGLALGFYGGDGGGYMRLSKFQKRMANKRYVIKNSGQTENKETGQ